MYSYKKEVLSGNTAYNVVTIIMRANLTDVSGGTQWISDRHYEVAQHFLATRDDVLNHRNGVPSWGKDIDEQVEKYVDALGISASFYDLSVASDNLQVNGFAVMTNGTSVRRDTSETQDWKLSNAVP
jgi:hypothetical protein